jgi:hypothetical protein
MMITMYIVRCITIIINPDADACVSTECLTRNGNGEIDSLRVGTFGEARLFGNPVVCTVMNF